MIMQYIPDLIGEVVAKVDEALPFPVYYDYETYEGVLKILQQKDGSISLKNKKFPLVWLVVDFKERFGTGLSVYSAMSNTKIIIAVNSDMNYTMKQRRDINYLPTLYPIHAELIKQFSIHKKFVMPSEALIEHEKTDLPKWGSPAGYVFNECVDALMIENLKLSVKRLYC